MNKLAEKEKKEKVEAEEKAENKKEKKEKAENAEEKTASANAEKLKNELKEKTDQLLRTLAEYDNFRKRSQKEKDAVFADSKCTVINEILPVLDNFERAAKNDSVSFEDYQKGINMIYEQFVSVISRLGVEAYGEKGEEFNPNIHNAVMHIEDEELGENVIAEVFAKGYKLGDRIVREATVKVAN
ncbi:MAG: nucleotide exchange factor GrpE [Clostridiales bacterium]|nr:nucleotide exchange factor GrpE [Clostridiales bacterium]